MCNVIWKFPLFTIIDEQTIEMPKDAEILSVQAQRGKLCIWALVNPKARKVKITFHLFETGQPVPKNKGTFIGTFQLHKGTLVLHLFKIL